MKVPSLHRMNNKCALDGQSCVEADTHSQSTQTKSTVPCTICSNETVGAVPVCPPERLRSGVSITKIHALCAGNLTMDAPLQDDTGGHTGTAPTHLHHIFPRNSTQTKEPFTCNLPQQNQPPMCNPFLPISTKPRGVSLPHRGYTFR